MHRQNEPKSKGKACKNETVSSGLELTASFFVAQGRPGELMEEVGGQVLELESAAAEQLQAQLKQELSVDATLLDQTLRMDGENVHELVPEIMKRYGDQVRRLQLAHPSLEDVFLHRTGKRFIVTQPEEPKKKKRRRR